MTTLIARYIDMIQAVPQYMAASPERTAATLVVAGAVVQLLFFNPWRRRARINQEQ